MGPDGKVDLMARQRQCLHFQVFSVLLKARQLMLKEAYTSERAFKQPHHQSHGRTCVPVHAGPSNWENAICTRPRSFVAECPQVNSRN